MQSRTTTTDNSDQLYRALELPRTATQLEIKKAYRRLALILHPDKNPSPQAADRFRDVNQAWLVLGDEKTRQIYDKYGMQGVEMARQFGGGGGDNGDGDIGKMAAMLALNYEKIALVGFMLVSIMVAFLSLFPIFLALRGDSVVMWSYGVVFVPVWLVDAFIYLGIVLRYFYHPSETENDDDPDTDDENDEELTPEELAGRKAERKRQLELIDYVVGTQRFIQWSLIVLFQVFCILKIDSTIGWSWPTVFIPWFIYECFSLLFTALAYHAMVTSPTSRLAESLRAQQGENFNIPTWVKLILAWKMFRFLLFRVVMAILVVAKLGGSITSSWATVFIPVYMLFVMIIIRFIIRYRAAKRMPESEAKSAAVASNILAFVALVVFGSLFFATLGMWIARLDSTLPETSYRVAIILVPVFLVLSLIFCCCCCFLPCCFFISGINVGDEESGGAINMLRNRIEFPGYNQTRSQQDILPTTVNTPWSNNTENDV